jgi:hypothetical protein
MRRKITREITLENRKKINQTHLHCPMELRQRGPHVGLYCSCHGTWIRWISQTEAAKIQDILSIS